MLGGAKKNVYKVELRVIAKPGLFLTEDAAGWLSRLTKKGTKLLETPDEDPTVRVKVDYNGRQRMFNLEKLDTAAPYIDITDEVTKGKKGHPVFKSIDDYSVQLRNDLLEQLGLESPE
jgi:hypothetical protein